MNGTSPRFLGIFPLIIALLTALACPAIAEDIKTLIKDAEGGNPEAQAAIGYLYSEGIDVPLDYVEAVKWFRMAAEQGNAKAQYNLGVSYANGQGVPQDYAEAGKWYLKSAEQGNTYAQYNLGVSYINGQGVIQNYLLAYFWCSLSASRSTGNDYDMRVKSRDRAARTLTPEQLMRVQQMTREWEENHPRN